MAIIMVAKNTVKDCSVWTTSFDSKKTMRGEFGMHIKSVYQAKKDPNMCFVIAKIEDMRRAQEFMKKIQEYGVQEKAGVIASERMVCNDRT